MAFIPPGAKATASLPVKARLESLRLTVEELAEESKGFSDHILITKLEDQVDELWPRREERIPDYLAWLRDARLLLDRLPRHQAALQRVRQEASLELVLAGQRREGVGSEPDWERVDPDLHWRYQTLQDLVTGLALLEEKVPDIEDRREFAQSLHKRTIDDHAEAWEEAINEIALGEHYEGLDIEPQVGLVPIGADPDSGLQEFWHLESGTRPPRDEETRKLSVSGDTGMVLVLLPGGTFRMGAQREDPEGPNYDPATRSDETPLHEVTLAPFFLSKYEMTQGQWRRIMEENPSFYQSDTGSTPVSAANPVEQVSWIQCEQALSRYRLLLPTEAQWEYGARAGTTTPWWCGATKNSIEESNAGNLLDAFARNNGAPESWGLFEGWSDGASVHAAVGSYAPNAYGLHDVIGNVWEWCRDRVGGYNFEVTEGNGLRAVEVQYAPPAHRVLRGGGFDYSAVDARSANRQWNTSVLRHVNLGVRPARVLD